MSELIASFKGFTSALSPTGGAGNRNLNSHGSKGERRVELWVLVIRTRYRGKPRQWNFDALLGASCRSERECSFEVVGE